MKRIQTIGLLMIFTGIRLTASPARSETIRKEMVISRPDAAFTLIVDNIWGSVTVKGVPGNTVKAVIYKTIDARSEEQLQQALEEVTLDISQESGLLEFYVDGPFRDYHLSKQESRWNDRKYKVTFRFELEIPQDISVNIHTVNDGDIRMDGVRGDYQVENVNGSITMNGLRGSGKACTINDDVICTFDTNPKADCEFGSLNGDVKLYFQNPLSADFVMKTFNGDAWSDFELTRIASDPEIIKDEDGRTRYQLIHRTCARAGYGGPRIELDGFNGDLFILNGCKGAQS